MFTDTERCPVINAPPSALSQCASEHQLNALWPEIILNSLTAEVTRGTVTQRPTITFFSCDLWNLSVFTSLIRDEEPGLMPLHLGRYSLCAPGRRCLEYHHCPSCRSGGGGSWYAWKLKSKCYRELMVYFLHIWFE